MSTPSEKLLSIALGVVETIDVLVDTQPVDAALKGIKAILRSFKAMEMGHKSPEAVREELRRYREGRVANNDAADKLVEELWPDDPDTTKED